MQFLKRYFYLTLVCKINNIHHRYISETQKSQQLLPLFIILINNRDFYKQKKPALG